MPLASFWPLPPPVAAVPPQPPRYATADFLAALQQMMPRGRAWPRDPEAVQTRLLTGIAEAQAAVHARQSDLLDDAFPATAAALLPEWEETFGLPDPCIGTPATEAARRALVLARLASRGGIAGSQSIGQLIAVAAGLGFTITIEEFTDAAAGFAVCGQPLYGGRPMTPQDWARAGSAAGTALADWSTFSPPIDWAFALRVHAGGAVVSMALCGSADAGEPLADWTAAALTTETFATVGDPGPGTPLARWGAEILECSLRKIAPAESVLIFAYH